MKIKATIGFIATIKGKKYRVQEGDELEMPDGANWVNEGLAVEVTGNVTSEKAVKPVRKKKDS